MTITLRRRSWVERFVRLPLAFGKFFGVSEALPLRARLLLSFHLSLMTLAGPDDDRPIFQRSWLRRALFAPVAFFRSLVTPGEISIGTRLSVGVSLVMLLLMPDPFIPLLLSQSNDHPEAPPSDL